MAREPKRQSCAWCGEYLGTYVSTSPNEESCGKVECERGLRQCEREEESARQERAAADGYDRY